MKSVLIAIIAAIMTTTQAVNIKNKDPIPEKPNQYNRVCDEVDPDAASCWAGNAAGAHWW